MKILLKRYAVYLLIVVTILLSNLGQLVLSNEQFQKEKIYIKKEQ